MPQQYYCHRCQRSFFLEDSAPIACIRCHEEFVELALLPDQRFPVPLGPADMLSSMGHDFESTLTEGARQQHLLENQRDQEANARVQQQHLDQQQASRAEQQQRQQQQSSQSQRPQANPLQMFFGMQAPNLQEILAQVPRLIPGLNFGQEQRAPSNSEATNRAGAQPPPAADSFVPNEEMFAGRNPRAASEPVTLEEFIEDLFGGAPPVEDNSADITFSIQFPLRGRQAHPEVEATMANLFASLQNPENTVRGFHENDIRLYLPMKKVTQAQVDNGAQCTTCFDTFKLGDDVGSLDCNHIFHRPCIEPWLKNKNSCPVCRQKISMSKWKRMHAKRMAEAMLDDLD